MKKTIVIFFITVASMFAQDLNSYIELLKSDMKTEKKLIITEAMQFSDVDSKVFSYGNPQAGEEKPEKYRRNYGLVLLKEGYDGAMDYAYQHEFGHIWNDFDHKKYRDHVFAYPTMNGVVDTIAWESFREGTYDVRYAATLLNVINNTYDKKLGQKALWWYKRIDPYKNDLDEIRKEMIKWILKLKNEDI